MCFGKFLVTSTLIDWNGRLGYQPLFGKGARALSPKFFSGRNVDQTQESGENRTSWNGNLGATQMERKEALSSSDELYKRFYYYLLLSYYIIKMKLVSLMYSLQICLLPEAFVYVRTYSKNLYYIFLFLCNVSLFYSFTKRNQIWWQYRWNSRRSRYVFKDSG